MNGYKLLPNVSYSVTGQSGSVLTVQVSDGALSAGVGQQYVAFIRTADSTVWAEVYVTQTNATTITVDRVINSSTPLDLPTFTGEVVLYSAISTENSNCNEDIILAIGQSNMQDPVTDSFDILRHAFPNVWHYPYSGTYQDTRVPLDKMSMIVPDPVGYGFTNTSCAIAACFADSYSQYISAARKVLVINHAASGKAFTTTPNWSAASGTLLTGVITAANKALGENPHARIAGVIVHMGESDFGITETGFYDHMVAMEAKLRADINTTAAFSEKDKERFPVIWGGLAPAWVTGGYTDVSGVHAALQRAAEINSHNAYCDPVGLASRPPNDHIHFTTASLETFGRRYFDTFKSVLNGGAITVIAPTAPGEFSALTTSNVSYESIDVSTTQVSGNPAPTYTAQYRVGAGTWQTSATGLTTASYSFTGLTENTQYGFRFIASNGVDPQRTSNEVTATTLDAVAPGAFGALSDSNLDKTSVTISASAVTGSPTPTYTAEYKTTASGTWLQAATDLANPSYGFTGLTSDTSYDFRFIADNGFGQSTSSTHTVSTLAGTAPAAFGALTQDSLGYFDAQYSAAAVTGDPTPTYSAEINENGTGWTTSASGLANPVYNFTGLTDNTAYQVRFVATNGVGSDSVSSAASFTTLDAVQPGAFGALTQDALDATSATYSVSAVTGSPAPTYAAQVNPNSAGWTTSATGLVTPSYTFTGLTESTSYEVRFVATNGVGSDSTSASASFTTPAVAQVQAWGIYRGADGPNFVDSSGSGNDLTPLRTPTYDAVNKKWHFNDHAVPLTGFNETGGYTKIVKFSLDGTPTQSNILSGSRNFFRQKDAFIGANAQSNPNELKVSVGYVAGTVYTIGVTCSATGLFKLFTSSGGTVTVVDTFDDVNPQNDFFDTTLGCMWSDVLSQTLLPMTGDIYDVMVYEFELTEAEMETAMLSLDA